MNWLIWALIAALLNGIADIFFKLVNGKIHSGLSGLIVNLSSIVPVLIFTLYAKSQKQTITSSPLGIVYSVLAGLFIGSLTIAMYKMFSQPGANLSLAIPVMRISIVVFAIFFGIFFFHDSINLKYIFGLILSIAGLFILATANIK